MQDDIDWMSASSDLGLVRLCREMDAIARPFEALRFTRVSRRKSPRRFHAAAAVTARSRSYM